MSTENLSKKMEKTENSKPNLIDIRAQQKQEDKKSISLSDEELRKIIKEEVGKLLREKELEDKKKKEEITLEISKETISKIRNFIIDAGFVISVVAAFAGGLQLFLVIAAGSIILAHLVEDFMKEITKEHQTKKGEDQRK